MGQEETFVKGKDLLSIADLSPQEVRQLVQRAHQMKNGGTPPVLAGKSVVLLFEKPSLRTRASFEIAVHQLGGHAFYMGGSEVGLGVREPVSDVARVLARYVDCVVARVNVHASLVELGRWCSKPVINALSDWEHPCQTLADLQTIYEIRGSFVGIRVAFIGDGNNVSRSLALGVAAVGASFAIASPQGYTLDSQTLALAKERASESGGSVESGADPRHAVAQADVVYTDVWTSMGQESESAARRRAFRGYVVDQGLLSHARPDALLMHPLPAHYGEEVPPGMLDTPASVVFDQAENRLHAQKAVLEFLVGPRGG